MKWLAMHGCVVLGLVQLEELCNHNQALYTGMYIHQMYQFVFVQEKDGICT